VSQPPDFDKIAALTKQLDEMCRQAEQIRAKIESTRHDTPPWPDRRRESRTFEQRESGGPARKPEAT
jgi:hypothetical protein